MNTAFLKLLLVTITVITACAGTRFELIEPDAEIVQLAGGFQFTEGPAADADGSVFFSDIPNRRIHKWSVDGELSTYREDLGATNGLFFDPNGSLVVCEMEHRQVSRLDPDGTRTLLADAYARKKLNTPNDLWVDPRGGVYFTDPYYGEQPETLEQYGFHVYYITPGDHSVVRVLNDLKGPNGIIGTADGRLLYVGDAGANKTYVFRIEPDGSLTGRRLFAPEAYDGLTLDEQGNLYVTGKGVNIYSPEGRLIGSIDPPEQPANLTFGGPDRRTLFMTARTGLYSLRMKVRGQ